MDELKNQPPQIGLWLLHLIYKADRLDEVSGDLFEIYQNRLETQGKIRASLHYLADVILSFRNVGLAKKTTQFKSNGWILLRSNINFTFRVIFKNRTYSVLNILGLSLGMAAFLFIMQYVSYEKSYDNFHTNRKDLYRIHYMATNANGELVKNCAVAAPRVAPYMKEKLPEVKAFARVQPWSGLVYSYNNKTFREDGTKLADNDILKIFDFPLIAGDPRTALRAPNSLVISQLMAQKYFGSESPLGKVIDIDGYRLYTITGVAKDVPNNSHIHFDFLLSYSTLKVWEGDGVETSWDWYDYYSYVLLEPGRDPRTVERKFERIFDSDVQGKRNRELHVKESFILQPITDIHLHSHLSKELEGEEQGDANAVFFLTLIAIFILVIAWINYINLSTARSMERAKEVGVRKTIGAFRRQLIQQFMLESFIINLTAFLIAIGIVVVGINYFNQLTNSKLDLGFLSDQIFWMKIMIAFLAGSIVSGTYPAFVLSSFQPISALRGKGGHYASGILLRRALVVVQFASSVTLIAGTMIVYEQLKYMDAQDLGFDMTKTIILRGPNPTGEEKTPVFASHNEAFKNELIALSGVRSVAASSDVPGGEIRYWMAARKLEAPREDSKLIYYFDTDEHYLPAYDIKLLAGRNFHFADTTSLILNDIAAKLMGFDSPESAIDHKVILGDKTYSIAGIVNDYNQVSVKQAVKPLAIQYNAGEWYFFTVKVDGTRYNKLLATIKTSYNTFWPKAPFDYFFLDEFYNRQYSNEQKFSRVFMLFSGFAIFVACLGLFGLSAFNASQKTKEIGIRKILGAEVTHIVYMLSKEFLVLVLVAVVIAIPVIYFSMSRWLENFAGRISIDLSVFLVSGFSVLLMALLTVSYKTVQTARSNPITALRYE